MIVFKDIISKDELFSDALPIKEVGAAYEVDCAIITIGAVEVNTGANASAEEAAEALDDEAKTGINVVLSHNLAPTNFDKKTYMVYIKSYLKAVAAKLAETNPERVADFKTESAELVKKILANFKDYEFYTGESMDPEGMVALLNYREDGVTPYFTFFKDGVQGEKF
ncbi:hypothetical protein H4R18_005265 [Coemansia javaensis]|uniref:Translationally-controlled tumor protein homolog n=1 Tax=Coemansia javaensis TaxID=2761396 RepID=A0A9W8H8A7_9FUNG|nr:hypothetical protein H4R18_005265 [Coemansia javaensis]